MAPDDMDNLLQVLRSIVAEHERSDLHAIVDCARDESLAQLVRGSWAQSRCLFSGKLTDELRDAAPYVIRMELNAGFTPRLLEALWGKGAAIFFVSGAALEDLRRHFRRFLIVRNAHGKHLFFRYFDPRVLRPYLPSCSPKERDYVYGPVEEYLIEDRDPSRLLRYWNTPRDLGQGAIDLASGEAVGQMAGRLGGD